LSSRSVSRGERVKRYWAAFMMVIPLMAGASRQ
jgi:hypothetical protein